MDCLSYSFKKLVTLLLSAILLFSFIGMSFAAEAKSASATTLSLSKSSIKFGESVTVSGTLSPAVSGATISIYKKVAGSNDFVLTATTTTDTQGSYSTSIIPSATSDIMASWGGDASNSSSQSDTARISVKALISIKFQGKTFSINKNSRIYGSVRPAHNGDKIYLQYLVGNKWRTSKTTRVNSSSDYSFTVVPKQVKTYRFRVKFSDDDHIANYSSQKSIKSVWPNPFGISSKYEKYIVVVKSSFKLYLIQRGSIVKTFPVVVGKSSTRTPSAFWRIGEKNPRGGGPQGYIVLRLYRGGRVYTRYGIHGTNQEYLLKRWPRGFSHGCIRMYNKDVAWLTKRVPVGTPVRTM